MAEIKIIKDGQLIEHKNCDLLTVSMFTNLTDKTENRNMIIGTGVNKFDTLAGLAELCVVAINEMSDCSFEKKAASGYFVNVLIEKIEKMNGI